MHYFTLLVCLFFSLTVSAQIQRGDWLLSLNGDTEVSFDGFTSNPLVASNLGGIAIPDDFSAAAAYATPTYGFALSNRFVVGGSALAILGTELGESGAGIGLAPYLRYYAINREKLGIYGQVSTAVAYGGGQFQGFEDFTGEIGLQWPLTTGIRVGPALGYTITDFRNKLDLSATIEIVLGRNTRPETSPTAGFKKGSVMLGGQYLSGTMRKKFRSLGATVGGHYFLTDRLTGILSLGVETFSFDFGTDFAPRDAAQTTYSFIVGSRYYFTTDRHLVWFGQIGGGYQFARGYQDNSGDREKYQSDNSLVSLSGGAQLFIRDNVALEFGPEYRISFLDGGSNGLLLLNVGARFIL